MEWSAPRRPAVCVAPAASARSGRLCHPARPAAAAAVWPGPRTAVERLPCIGLLRAPTHLTVPEPLVPWQAVSSLTLELAVEGAPGRARVDVEAHGIDCRGATQRQAARRDPGGARAIAWAAAAVEAAGRCGPGRGIRRRQPPHSLSRLLMPAMRLVLGPAPTTTGQWPFLKQDSAGYSTPVLCSKKGLGLDPLLMEKPRLPKGGRRGAAAVHDGSSADASPLSTNMAAAVFNSGDGDVR